MLPSELLRQAHVIWRTNPTTGAFARDATGYELADPSSPHAVCWCAIGAIHRAAGEHSALSMHSSLPVKRARHALFEASESVGGTMQANDTGHLRDLHWTRAIELAERKEKEE